jgi:hypothetical protein
MFENSVQIKTKNDTHIDISKEKNEPSFVKFLFVEYLKIRFRNEYPKNREKKTYFFVLYCIWF